tara:strand:- start:1192 stop:1491 length:300 start_codon:yes stop_codon:yes gene_type:complete
MPELDLSKIEDKNLPEKKLRSGSVYLTIWKNKKQINNDKVAYYYTVTLERRYKKDGEWKASNTYRVNDLPKAVMLLDKAYEFMTLEKSGKEMAEGINGT